MKKFFRSKKMKNLLNNENGQGMVEYILLLVVIIVIVGLFRTRITAQFNAIMGRAETGVGDVIQ